MLEYLRRKRSWIVFLVTRGDQIFRLIFHDIEIGIWDLFFHKTSRYLRINSCFCLLEILHVINWIAKLLFLLSLLVDALIKFFDTFFLHQECLSLVLQLKLHPFDDHAGHPDRVCFCGWDFFLQSLIDLVEHLSPQGNILILCLEFVILAFVSHSIFLYTFEEHWEFIFSHFFGHSKPVNSFDLFENFHILPGEGLMVALHPHDFLIQRLLNFVNFIFEIL